jgi:putative membrane protein
MTTATTIHSHSTVDNRRFALALLVGFFIALAWSAVGPYSYLTWFLEVVPALVALPVLLLTHRRFPLTKLLYALIFLHALVLIVGGHFTYAREPLFTSIRDHFHLARNYYDRLGHFAQGFVPALIAREVFIRRRIVKRGGWMFAIVLCVCLAIGAAYELFEWRVAVAAGTAADDFLGAQGDPWDTQEDMATCLVGAACGLLFLSRFHDRQLARLAAPAPSFLSEFEAQEHVVPDLHPGHVLVIGEDPGAETAANAHVTPAEPETEPAPPHEPSDQPVAALEPRSAFSASPPERLIRIRPALADEDVRTVRELFVEYGHSLGFSLAFQNFDQEYLTLPGKYAPPRGRLFLAEVDGRPAGCIALRPLETGVCEMKRLYVRGKYRGLGLGRQLAEKLIAEATETGYFLMRLDTVEDKMRAAVALYRSLGFEEIGPYTLNPMPGARFMQRQLAPITQLNLYGG